MDGVFLLFHPVGVSVRFLDLMLDAVPRAIVHHSHPASRQMPVVDDRDPAFGQQRVEKVEGGFDRTVGVGIEPDQGDRSPARCLRLSLKLTTTNLILSSRFPNRSRFPATSSNGATQRSFH